MTADSESDRCRRLARVWQRLGDAFDGRDDVLIAKMDATANYLDGLQIHSFPTLTLFTKVLYSSYV